MDKVIVVSGDSHAVMPPELWPDYLERRFHEFLPAAREDNLTSKPVRDALYQLPSEALGVMDRDGVWQSGGYMGVWDVTRRIREMDREGVAAEVVVPSDGRAHLLLSPDHRSYPQEVIAAGMRAYHRWAFDEFGSASGRVLLVGDVSGAVDMDAMLAELEWLSAHGFVGTYGPGRVARSDLPPLSDRYFDPFWAKCVELGLVVAVHAGHGMEHEEGSRKLKGLRQKMEAAGRSNLQEEVLHHSGGFFELDLRPRQSMWQMMIGGVFDRHPALRLAIMELRGDWLPATLKHLDAAFVKSRADLPATTLPSEVWKSNCVAVLSFMHKSEAEIRSDIGVETMAFGRDYPHPEGTWPNTGDWLSDLFAGVPDQDVRKILGENLVRVFGLDRDNLKEIAEQVGPTMEQITGATTEIDRRLVSNFQDRGGYLKPVEQIDRDAIDALLREDITHAASAK